MKAMRFGGGRPCRGVEVGRSLGDGARASTLDVEHEQSVALTCRFAVDDVTTVTRPAREAVIGLAVGEVLQIRAPSGEEPAKESATSH